VPCARRPTGSLVALTSPVSSQNLSLPPDLASAAQAIDDELRRKPRRVMALTAEAVDALMAAQSDYLGDLGDLGREAIRLARKDRLRTVDQEHVDQAIARLGLTSKEGGLASAASTLGGVIAGAGGAAGYAIAFTDGPHSTAEIVTAIVLCIVGFFLLAVGVTLTMVKRR
jgi:hypothetical protein